MMKSDAAQIIDKQTCFRKFLLAREWMLSRWRPKSLFDNLLRHAIYALGQGQAVEKVIATGKAAFFERAAEPGLDIIGGNPYQLSKNWCAMLDTVLRGVAKTALPVLHDVDPAHLTGKLEWKFSAKADDSGQLHRWLTVDNWDRDALSRELHSWRTIADMVMAETPMLLHVIVIGPQREGLHRSPWARAYLHPAMPNLKMRFNKPSDTTWKTIYLVERHDMNAEDWVELAWSQGALQALLVDVAVNVPSEAVCRETRLQLAIEALAMREAVEKKINYLAVPMSRGACDLYVPCVYQNICYNDGLVAIDKMGLYTRRVHSNVSG